MDTPQKFNIEPENDSFRSRDLLFQGSFSGSMLNFGGVSKKFFPHQV